MASNGRDAGGPCSMRRVLLILLIVVFASTVVYLIPDLFQLHPPRWEFYRDPKAYENRYRMIDGRRVEAIASLIGVALIGGVVVLIVPALGKYVLRGAATARERRASRIREMIHQEV